MGDVRRLIGLTVAGVGTCTCMLFTAPVGDAAGLGFGPRSPAPGEPFPPPIILVPATGSADALVKVVGNGFVTCAAANGEVTSSRNGEVFLTATGDASLSWDGIAPVTIVRIDEKLKVWVSLEIVNSTPPGDHRFVGRCIDDESTGTEEGGTSFPNPAVPSPPESGAAVPGGNSADSAPASPVPSNPSAPETAPVVPDNPDSTGAVESPSVSSDVRTPAGDGGSAAIVAEPPLPDTGPMAWGTLVGALILAGAVPGVPLLIPPALQARRGPKWVRTNVRAVADTAPAVGIGLTPQIDDRWLPTAVVRFALHADRGTQTLTEVEQ